MSINSKPPGTDGAPKGSDSSIDELIAAGTYGQAAARAEELGLHARAVDLYERVWDFSAAARCAEAAGDLARALKNAIDARVDDDIARLAKALEAQGEDGRFAALEVLSSKRHFSLAAPLAEALGEVEQAIDLYRSGHLELDAARLLAAAGRHNEAGRLLEKVVEHADLPAEKAEAHLRLGRLLAGRMRHDDAVRHLQEASHFAATRDEARRLLIVELAALGLRDAARDVLVDARKDDPSLPVDIDELIRTSRPSETPREDAQIIAGRYRVEELLGAGGAGRVYRAHDEVAGRKVAIKLFSTNYTHGHEGFERFVREAKIASSLKHANLVEGFDFSAEQGYLVMELMTGGSLATRLRPRLKQSSARRMALDMLGGLELAHRRGIIHRDVKPANVFFDSRGTAKLGDFGVAHLLDLGQTQTGGLIGTLAYMSPEQITGAPLTIAADLYAVGVTLFEAVTGRLPFQGPDFVAEHLGSEPPRPTDIDGDLAPGWDPLIARLLAKSPADRFESVDDVRRALLHLELGGDAHRLLVIPRARASASRPAVPDPTEPAAETEATEEAPRERYQFETRLGSTTVSTLSRAVDTALERTVIIERFNQPLDTDAERRLFGLARGGSPFVQRALGYDRAAGVAVFEAPNGSPMSDAFPEPPSPDAICQLLKRLGHALAPLHSLGFAHGSLSGKTVVVDDHGFPTVMVAGLGPVPERMDASADSSAAVALVNGLSRVESTATDLLRTVLPEPSAAELARLEPMMSPTSGEALYALATELEIALARREHGS